ncbi:MAG: hypothetical protein AB1540_05895 [Bdellovibrionota bacterium]
MWLRHSILTLVLSMVLPTASAFAILDLGPSSYGDSDPDRGPSNGVRLGNSVFFSGRNALNEIDLTDDGAGKDGDDAYQLLIKLEQEDSNWLSVHVFTGLGGKMEWLDRTYTYERTQRGFCCFGSPLKYAFALPLKQKIEIFAKGGNGADGMDGADQRRNYIENYDGQNGGNGGRGGNVTVYFNEKTEQFLDDIVIHNRGGKGGKGGKAHRSWHIPGESDGRDGADGADGTLEYVFERL